MNNNFSELDIGYKCQKDPVFFAKHILGVKTLKWQGHIDILNAIALHDRISVTSGHCFGKGTEILMFDGSTKKVEDIQVGDVLMGDDFTPRNVLKLSRGREEMYEVNYYDGTKYIHNQSHILCLKNIVDLTEIEISIFKYLKLNIKKQNLYAGFKLNPYKLLPIKNIKSLGIGNYYGFEIDGNQRFLGSDFMVLHNSMGKDWLAGLVSVWFLWTHPESVVLTTAPSARQVEKIIWGEIRNFVNNAKFPFTGAKVLETEIKISEKHYALGFTTKEAGDSSTAGIGRFQGFKGRAILIVATEAQAIDDQIFEQIEGCLTAPVSKLYLAGNSLRESGYFIRSLSDPTFKHFSFSCYESPNYIAKKEVVPGMVSYEWVKDKETRWGKDSVLFQTRVLAIPPTFAHDTLVSVYECQKAVDCETPKKGCTVLSLDPAAGGADECVFALAYGGEIKQILAEQGMATTHTVGKAINLIKNFNPDFFVIDKGTFGTAMYDSIDAELEKESKDIKGNKIKTQIIGFNFGGKSISGNFGNLGTETWYNAAQNIKNFNVKLPNDESLINQLATRKYDYNEKGKIQLESKKKMKSRGLSSPDRADAVVMALFASIDEQNLSLLKYENNKETDDLFELSLDLNPLGYPLKSNWDN